MSYYIIIDKDKFYFDIINNEVANMIYTYNFSAHPPLTGPPSYEIVIINNKEWLEMTDGMYLYDYLIFEKNPRGIKYKSNLSDCLIKFIE